MKRKKDSFLDLLEYYFNTYLPVLALLRTVDPQPFKRAENAYEHSWLSEKYSGLNLSKQYLSSFLRLLGDMRGHSIAFMKEYIGDVEHLLFGGTRITKIS